MFLYAYGAAFAFSISTLRRNLFVSPPLTPLSPRGERGKPITIFVLDISLPRNYNKFAGHTIAYVDNVIPTGYGSALSIKNPPAFAGGFFYMFLLPIKQNVALLCHSLILRERHKTIHFV